MTLAPAFGPISGIWTGLVTAADRAGFECPAGMTCWRRLRDWQRAGVWDLMHFALLDWLARSDQIDWSQAGVDSCSVPF
jgi:transposase